jgi:hypothetical protein
MTKSNAASTQNLLKICERTPRLTPLVASSELNGLRVAKDIGDPFRRVVADYTDKLADSSRLQANRLTFLFDPLLYPFLPLLDGSAVQQGDDDNGHVVASDATQL